MQQDISMMPVRAFTFVHRQIRMASALPDLWSHTNRFGIEPTMIAVESEKR